MALFRGLFVRKDTTRGTTPVEARKALAGLVTPAGAGAARPGVLTGGNVTGTAGWAYSVPALVAVMSRGASDGAVLAGNDGALSVSTDPAPASGSRIDIVWIRHADVDSGDPTSDIECGVAKGAASGTPVAPTIPTGALELARATVATGATNTQHANVTISHTAARTALRGAPLPVLDTDARDAYGTALAAAGIVSGLSPAFVWRADGPYGGVLEITTDGSSWRPIQPGVGTSSVSDTLGGGALAAAWGESSSPASLLLPVGEYLVSVKAGFTLSLAANSNVEVHLFNAAGVAFGSGQGSNRNVPSNAQAGVGSFTAEFTRLITVTDPASPVRIRARVTPTGGTHTFGAQSLTAVRVA